MKLTDIDEHEKLVTKDYLEVVLGRLENRLVERFNAIEKRFIDIDAKFATQRTLLIVAIIGIVAQILNTWIVHVKG